MAVAVGMAVYLVRQGLLRLADATDRWEKITSRYQAEAFAATDSDSRLGGRFSATGVTSVLWQAELGGANWPESDQAKASARSSRSRLICGDCAVSSNVCLKGAS